jgi:phosphotransferase system  glucose/maltose/N-acetylglucosamine-specific IIC component
LIAILLFLAFGWLVMSHRKPIVFAAWCAGIGAVLNLVLGASIGQMAVTGLINFAFFSGVFWLVDRFAGEVMRPIIVLIVGGVMYFLLGVIL